MYAIKNKIQLIGSSDMPTINLTKSGFKQAIINVTTTDSYFNEDGNKITTSMKHRCMASGKLADIIEKYLVEGMEVALPKTTIKFLKHTFRYQTCYF